MNAVSFRLVLVACLLSVVAVRGVEVEKEERSKAKEIIPLAVGNKWEYKKTSVNDQGKKEVKKVYTGVMDTKKVGGHTWYRFLEMVEDLKRKKETDSEFFVRSAEDGQREVVFAFDDEGKQTDKIEEIYLYFAYPVKKTPHENQTPYSTVTTVSTNEKVTVPAGTFECYHYQTQGMDENGKIEDKISVEFWVAPGVGTVKYHAMPEPGKKEVIELVSLDLKEDAKLRAAKHK